MHRTPSFALTRSLARVHTPAHARVLGYARNTSSASRTRVRHVRKSCPVAPTCLRPAPAHRRPACVITVRATTYLLGRALSVSPTLFLDLYLLSRSGWCSQRTRDRSWWRAARPHHMCVCMCLCGVLDYGCVCVCTPLTCAAHTSMLPPSFSSVWPIRRRLPPSPDIHTHTLCLSLSQRDTHKSHTTTHYLTDTTPSVTHPHPPKKGRERVQHHLQMEERGG